MSDFDFKDVRISVTVPGSSAVITDLSKSVPVTVSLTLPQGHRPGHQVYLCLDAALVCQSKAVHSPPPGILPNDAFTGFLAGPTGASAFRPTWDADLKMLLAAIPPGAVSTIDDESNQVTLRWDVSLKAGTSGRVAHQVVAWVVEQGISDPLVKSSLLVFEIVPPAPVLKNAGISGPTVYLDGQRNNRYWIGNPASATISGTVEADLAFAYVSLSPDGGKNWGAPQAAQIDAANRKNFTLPFPQGLPDPSAAGSVLLQIKVSQAKDKTPAELPTIWSSASSLTFQMDTAAPVITGAFTVFDASRATLELSASVTDTGSGLASVEYSLADATWRPIPSHHGGDYAISFPQDNKTLDFSKGIHVRATDHCGNTCSSVMVPIDSEVFKIECGLSSNIRLMEQTLGAVTVSPKIPGCLFPGDPDGLQIVWPAGLLPQEPRWTYKAYDQLVCIATLALEDPRKVWKPIGELQANLSGALITPGHLNVRVPGSYLPPRPQFGLQQKTVVAHSGEIWLHGTFTQPPLDSTTEHPLIFEYAIGQGAYKSVAGIDHVPNDVSFSVRLPDPDFPDQTSPKNVKLRIRYQQDQRSDANVEIPGITIQVDNQAPVFGKTHLSVLNGKALVATGQVRGHRQMQEANPVKKVGISWGERDDESAIQWATVPLVSVEPASNNEWKFTIETPCDRVTKALRPVLHAQLTSGIRSSLPCVFPNAIGLVDVVMTVDDKDVTMTPPAASSSSLKGTHDVKASPNAVKLQVKLQFTPRVSITRMNVIVSLAKVAETLETNQHPQLMVKKAAAVVVTPGIINNSNADRITDWDGVQYTQMLALSQAAAAQVITVKIPLEIAPVDARYKSGQYMLAILLTDPEGLHEDVKTAFNQETRYELTLNVKS